MATRPIFIPLTSNSVGVITKSLEFKWHPGLAKIQKQKSIKELHKIADKFGLKNVLEVSSKSQDNTGIALSAFNLKITTKKHKQTFSVESAFQSSKVFNNGGPFIDLICVDSLSAKRDSRLKESGTLISFKFFNYSFPLTPKTYFYDWLYINAMNQNANLCSNLHNFDGFTDIEFNPNKSFNCQAHSVALYISLFNNNLLKKALISPDSFLTVTKSYYSSIQESLF